MSIFSCHLLRRCCRNTIKRYQPVRHNVHKGAYEGDGRTTMTILNRDADYGLMVDAVTPIGFRLNIGIYVLGPMIIFPRTIIGWNIGSTSDIHEDSLALFKVMIPRPDIMILGLDNHYPRDAPFIVDFKRIMKNLDINLEILPVDKACTTFNFLNAERRFAVGAFLPPRALDTVNLVKLEDMAFQRAISEPIRGSD